MSPEGLTSDLNARSSSTPARLLAMAATPPVSTTIPVPTIATTPLGAGWSIRFSWHWRER